MERERDGERESVCRVLARTHERIKWKWKEQQRERDRE